MLSGDGKILVQKDKNGKVSKVLIYVPQVVAMDSQFPVRDTTSAEIEIQKDRIIVEIPRSR